MLVRVDNMITKQNASSFIDLIMPFKNDPYFNYKSDMLKLILLISIKEGYIDKKYLDIFTFSQMSQNFNKEEKNKLKDLFISKFTQDDFDKFEKRFLSFLFKSKYPDKYSILLNYITFWDYDKKKVKNIIENDINSQIKRPLIGSYSYSIILLEKIDPFIPVLYTEKEADKLYRKYIEFYFESKIGINSYDLFYLDDFIHATIFCFYLADKLYKKEEDKNRQEDNVIKMMIKVLDSMDKKDREDFYKRFMEDYQALNSIYDFFEKAKLLLFETPNFRKYYIVNCINK